MDYHTKDRNYKGAYMIVQQCKIAKPHGFYKKIGFVTAPNSMSEWKDIRFDMAVCTSKMFFSSGQYLKMEVNHYLLNINLGGTEK
jgi:hypothetical protein